MMQNRMCHVFGKILREKTLSAAFEQSVLKLYSLKYMFFKVTLSLPFVSPVLIKQIGPAWWDRQRATQ